MPTELWIAACIVSTAIGMAIAYADASRWNRSLPRQVWQRSSIVASAPEQGSLLADALQQEAA